MLKPAGGKYEGVWFNELKNGDTTFYIAYRDEHGESVKKKVGKATKQSRYTVRDAYDALIAVKHSLNTGQDLPFKNLRKKTYSLDEIFNEFLAWEKANGKKSWDADEQRYRVHIAPAFAKKDISKITTKEIEAFKQEKLKSKSSVQTVKHILALFRLVFNYAIKQELVKGLTNPIQGGKVKLPTPDNAKLGFLSREQAIAIFEALKQYPNPRLYQLTVLLLGTGARFDEVVSLRWQDIDYNDNTIYFKPTKNGNARRIFITDLVKNVLDILKKEKKSDTDLIAKSAVGKKFGDMPKQWQDIVDDVLEGNKTAAKYRITVHSLRHTHASWLAQSGLDIMHIKEQLGHKTIQMTMRYSHLIPDQRHDAVKKIMDF